jgi:serine/threonine-protein kinase
VFGAIALCAVAQALVDFPRLPEHMASHFGPSGLPNGWMSKQAFFAVYAVTVGLAALVGYLVPRSIAKKPPERINLPNKEYWLAPERRAETLAFFERYFAWYSCVLLLILVLAMGFAIQANLSSHLRMPTGPILAIIFAFMAFNLLWVVQMMRHFSKAESPLS